MRGGRVAKDRKCESPVQSTNTSHACNSAHFHPVIMSFSCVPCLRTDLYLHFVNPKDNSIMEVDAVLALIDKNSDYLDELYKEFNVLLSEVRITPLSSPLIFPDDQRSTTLLPSHHQLHEKRRGKKRHLR